MWLNNFLDWQGAEAHEKIVMLGKIEGRRNSLFLSIKWYTNTFLYTVADIESMTYQ